MSRSQATRSPESSLIFVNGRYLGRPATGVERFANGVLQAIEADAPVDVAERVRILAPRGVARPAWIGRLGFETVGRGRGHAWEQSELLRASRKGVLVNLCNSGPVLHPRQIVVLHDALVYRHPETFSLAYRTLHRTLGRLLAKRSRLATVSRFSRAELAELLRVPEGAIAIVPNAVDHMQLIQPDPAVVERLGLAGRPFLLFVGSPAPNKNLAATVRAFADLNRPDVSLVLVGSASGAFAQTVLGTLPPNVVAAGRLSDGEVKALYEATTGMIFPSLYEGFGIPPLEAMSVGCPVLAGDIPATREVCGPAAAFFDPRSQEAMASAMGQFLADASGRNALREAGSQRVRAFSWRRSAEALLDAIDRCERGDGMPSMPHGA